MPDPCAASVNFHDMPEVPYRASRLMKALGNPKAYALVKLLQEKKVLSVQAIAEALNRSPWDTSKILRVLRDLEVVRYQRSGALALYTLKDEPGAADMMAAVEKYVSRAAPNA